MLIEKAFFEAIRLQRSLDSFNKFERREIYPLRPALIIGKANGVEKITNTMKRNITSYIIIHCRPQPPFQAYASAGRSVSLFKILHAVRVDGSLEPLDLSAVIFAQMLHRRSRSC